MNLGNFLVFCNCIQRSSKPSPAGFLSAKTLFVVNCSTRNLRSRLEAGLGHEKLHLPVNCITPESRQGVPGPYDQEYWKEDFEEDILYN